MKAKLGNEIVEYWQISLTKPANESWVLEAFKKGQLSWSGQLIEINFISRILSENTVFNKVFPDKSSIPDFRNSEILTKIAKPTKARKILINQVTACGLP